jgi:Alkylmercury lyase
MLLFRSEEHVDRWCEERNMPKGGTLTPEQLWELARTWYEARMSPGWRRRTPQETEEVFAGLGLTGEFWRLR